MADGIVAAILSIFVAIALVWAFLPLLFQLGTVYGLAFAVLTSVVIIGAIIGIFRG